MEDDKKRIEVEEDEDTQRDKYLTFSIGSDCFGIDILYVTEIIGLQQITAVPDMPKYIKGIINLRGKIIPVMDVRIRFKKEEKKYDERTCIIVVDINNLYIGLIVDRVSEVTVIPEENVSEPPKINSSHQSKYVKGIGKVGEQVKLLLDCETLLSDEEMGDIRGIN